MVATADHNDITQSSAAATGPSLTCRQILTPPVCQITTPPYRNQPDGSSYYENSSSPSQPRNFPQQQQSSSSSGGQQLQFTPRQPAWECTFSPDGLLLAVAYGAPDPVIRIFQYHPTTTTSTTNNKTTEIDDPVGRWSLQATLTGIHEKTVRSVAFAPLKTTRILASASFDGTVAIWEPEEQFHNAGSLDTLQIVQSSQQQQQQTQQEWISSAQLEGHDTEVKCVRWNATGSLLATCGRDKSVWIWEAFLPGSIGSTNNIGSDEQFECLAVLHGHEGDVKCVRFAPSHGAWGNDGDEILLSASYDDTIKCWAEDAGDWYCVATLSGVHSSTIWSLTLSPSGARLVAGSEDGAISIYKGYYTPDEREQLARRRGTNNNNDNKAAWHCVGKLDAAHSHTAVYCVDYAPAAVGHGRIASGGGDNRIVILREEPQSTSHEPLFSAEVTSLATDSGDINCVAWHPHRGNVLASTGDDGSVRLWNFVIQ